MRSTSNRTATVDTVSAPGKALHVITVPYDSGVREVRMGAGPAVLAAHLVQHLAPSFRAAIVQDVVAPATPFPAEIATAFAVSREVATAVRRATAEGRLPVVLSGSCYAALGVIAGLAPRRPGIVWFDSHADFNTPDTTRSGFLDGMALAMVTGRCWHQLARRIEGFEPITEETVVLVGARDLDHLEHAALEASAVHRVSVRDARGGASLSRVLGRLGVRQLYLHIDLDVLDPREARANDLAAPNGLSVEELTHAVMSIGKTLPIAAVALTAYDPQADPEGNVVHAAGKIMEGLLSCRITEP